MSFVGERYRFTDDVYPGFGALDELARQQFILKHSVLHMNKSVGALATEAEAADHGGTIDGEKVSTAIAKMLVNVVKLAEERGITPERLGTLVPEVMRSK